MNTKVIWLWLSVFSVLSVLNVVSGTTHIVFDNMTSNKTEAVSLCGSCLNLADQALNYLLNYILKIGVVGSCAEICGFVQNKTSSKTIGAVCNILCDVVGIEEFVKIIQNADLDPIYYCELLKVCEINDNGDAKIESFSIAPNVGPQGQFTAFLQYSSMNGTGTGEIIIKINTIDSVPVDGSFLNLPQKPGNYAQKISINASPDPDCDPTEDPCEEWLPGTYQVLISICNGECGSKHPHSAVYDSALANFTITN